MAVDAAAPTSLRGVVNPSVAPWASFASQARDKVPELQWPRSNDTYDRMLADAQLAGLYWGTFGPIEDYRWWVDPNGNDEARVALLAEDLGLPVGPPADGEVQRTSLPGEFDFGELLHEALLAPIFGHYYFEWAGEVRDGRWRLVEVAPLHPSTLTEIRADRQGRLEHVAQQAGASFSVMGGTVMASQPPQIDAGSLIPFVFWPDATRKWIGRSLLRPCYRPWLCKDVLIRVDVTNHERAGGVPWIATDERYQGTSLDDLQRLASEFRVDEEGGAALPPGATLNLARAGGTDIVSSIRYHDEQMSKVWQTMVRELGQTATGSRALGETMGDLETLARRAVAGWAAKTLNRWVCSRWWMWNFGERNAPVLRFTPPELEGPVEVETPPAAGDGESPPDPPVAATAKLSPRRAAAEAAAPSFQLPGRSRLPERDVRRELTDIEVRAAVDFAAIDVMYEDTAARLERLFLDEWLPEQLDAIDEGITTTASGSERTRLTALDMARLTVPVVGVDDLTDELLGAAQSGAGEAVAELSAQGRDLSPASEAKLRAAVADHAKAVASMMADGVGMAASRRAVQLAASGLSPAGVAAEVRSYVEGLAHQWERDQLSGAVQQSINAGRIEVFDRAEGEGTTFYVSALLDATTCDPCAEDDGRELASIAEVQALMPSGGNVNCLGGPRCRCTVVAVSSDEG
jgi:hypothetical protein